MKPIYYHILRLSKHIWIQLLKRKLPYSFYSTEKIVRVIYSENNINPRTRVLKANFFKNKDGLSCMRLDFTDADFCKAWGKHFEPDNNPDRKYFGLACTYPKYVYLYDQFWSLEYTPLLDEEPKNPFHSDIFNSIYELEDNTAAAAEFNLLIDDIKTKWVVNEDENVEEEEWLNGDIVAPALNLQ